MSAFPEKGLTRLRDALKASGIKQKTLAKRLGVNPGTVNRWIKKGVRPQSERTERELADQLGVCWEWLFDDEYEGPAKPSQACNRTVDPFEHPDRADEERTATDASDYDTPDATRHKAQRNYEPDIDWYMDAVREVLTSDDPGTVIALQSNIVQFRELVRRNDERQQDKELVRRVTHQNQQLNAQNRELTERVAELERKLRTANQARGPSQRTEATENTSSHRIQDDDLQNSGNG